MTSLSVEDLRAIMRADFYSFMTRCFAELYGGVAFLPNWHLELLAAKLQATREGRIRRLIINIPPRHLKSLAASAALPAWWLGHAPDAAIVCATYAQDLSDKFSRDCRALMQSSWYRATFATRLTTQRAALQELITTKGGFPAGDLRRRGSHRARRRPDHYRRSPKTGRRYLRHAPGRRQRMVRWHPLFQAQRQEPQRCHRRHAASARRRSRGPSLKPRRLGVIVLPSYRRM